MPTAILGKTGMLGSEVEKFFLENNQEIISTSRKELDAQHCSEDDIVKVVKDCEYVINCIGIIKSYIHDDDSREVERAVEVNALFPHKLARACGITGSKLIQIATDCVYDGVKGSYIETDRHNPIDVYGKTKSLGEVNSDNVLNLRCSIIGREQKNYLSLLEWFLNQPKNAKVKGFKNHLWNGVTTRAFAKICFGIIRSNTYFAGLQHVVPEGIVSKAQMLHIFKDVFDRDDIDIQDIDAEIEIDRTIGTTRKDKNKALWQNAGYSEIPTVEEMIQHYF